MALSRNQFEKEIAAFAAEQRRLIETEVSGFSTDPAASRERRERAFKDYEYFCQTYFPHYVNDTKSVFHEYLFAETPKLIDDPKGCREADAAPRGEAKSTLLTQLLSLWCQLTGRKWFTVIIMDSFDQAAMMLEAIKAELEYNPRLQQDFPQESGRGRVWQTGVIVTANNRKVQVAGTGKKIRGWRHGPKRPDLTILDDIENDENVRSLAQRNKIENWVKKSVLKLGPPDGSMDVIYIGTILHYDSVLNRTLKKPVWRSHRFKSVIQWPNRMDLWDEWEGILANQSEEAADRYYEKNKKRMDQGAVVSWPGMRPLYALMKERADSHEAFDSELQNDPTNDEHAPFKEIAYWVHVVRHWLYFGVCDPSLGKNNKARDPSAILVGGYDRDTGILDVVEASIRRRVPDRIIEDIIAYQIQYNCLVWGIESVQFQEFLRTELVKRSAQRQVPVPAVPIVPHTDKQLRIESLQPHVQNGLIRIHTSQTTLYEQLRHYPEADHDDGPDALEILWKLALSNAGGIPKIASRGRRGGTNYRGY